MISALNTISVLSDEVDLENPQRRCPCLLLIDVSQSVQDYRTQLEGAIPQLLESIMAHKIASSCLELGIIAFNSKPHPILKIQEVYRHMEEGLDISLECGGRTHTGEAVLEALDALDARVKATHESGLHTYQPILVILSDGMPNFCEKAKEMGQTALEQAYEQVRRRVAAHKLQVLSIGVGPHCKDEVLDQLAGGNAGTGHLRLNDLHRLPDLFRFISTSLINSACGDSILSNSLLAEQFGITDGQPQQGAASGVQQ